MMSSSSYWFDKFYKGYSSVRDVPEGKTLFDENVTKMCEKQVMESYLKKCVSCYCCSRHQINKPKTLSPWSDASNTTTTVLVLSPTVENVQAMGCRCDCRHTARIICRMCED